MRGGGPDYPGFLPGINSRSGFRERDTKYILILLNQNSGNWSSRTQLGVVCQSSRKKEARQ